VFLFVVLGAAALMRHVTLREKMPELFSNTMLRVPDKRYTTLQNRSRCYDTVQKSVIAWYKLSSSDAEKRADGI